MQHFLNGVHISEVPTFVAESSSVTTDEIQLGDLLKTAHPLIIML